MLPEESPLVMIRVSQEEASALLSILLDTPPTPAVPDALVEQLLRRVAEACYGRDGAGSPSGGAAAAATPGQHSSTKTLDCSG